MKTFPFQPADDWRKLGYRYFQDSLEYRKILEENPQWGVTELPPVGTQLRTSGDESGQFSLSQASFLFSTSSSGGQDDIFPFESEESYRKSLFKYTVYGVTNRDLINGLSSDSQITLYG